MLGRPISPYSMSILTINTSRVDALAILNESSNVQSLGSPGGTKRGGAQRGNHPGKAECMPPHVNQDRRRMQVGTKREGQKLGAPRTMHGACKSVSFPRCRHERGGGGGGLDHLLFAQDITSLTHPRASPLPTKAMQSPAVEDANAHRHAAHAAPALEAIPSPHPKGHIQEQDLVLKFGSRVSFRGFGFSVSL